MTTTRPGSSAKTVAALSVRRVDSHPAAANSSSSARVTSPPSRGVTSSCRCAQRAYHEAVPVRLSRVSVRVPVVGNAGAGRPGGNAGSPWSRARPRPPVSSQRLPSRSR